MKRSKSKKRSLSVGVLWAVAVLGAASRVLADGSSPWIILPVLFIVGLGVIVGVIAGAVRKSRGNDTAVHSHDRLGEEPTVRCRNDLEHWKNQLDGFLENGLIDKDEYRVLWEKFRRQ